MISTGLWRYIELQGSNLGECLITQHCQGKEEGNNRPKHLHWKHFIYLHIKGGASSYQPVLEHATGTSFCKAFSEEVETSRGRTTEFGQLPMCGSSNDMSKNPQKGKVVEKPVGLNYCYLYRRFV